MDNLRTDLKNASMIFKPVLQDKHRDIGRVLVIFLRINQFLVR